MHVREGQIRIQFNRFAEQFPGARVFCYVLGTQNKQDIVLALKDQGAVVELGKPMSNDSDKTTQSGARGLERTGRRDGSGG